MGVKISKYNETFDFFRFRLWTGAHWRNLTYYVKLVFLLWDTWDRAWGWNQNPIANDHDEKNQHDAPIEDIFFPFIEKSFSFFQEAGNFPALLEKYKDIELKKSSVFFHNSTSFKELWTSKNWSLCIVDLLWISVQ